MLWFCTVGIVALMALSVWLGRLTSAPVGGGGDMLGIELGGPAAARRVIEHWRVTLGDVRTPTCKAEVDDQMEVRRALLTEARCRGLDWVGSVHDQISGPLWRWSGGSDKIDLGWAAAVRGALHWDSLFIVSYVLSLGFAGFWVRAIQRQGPNWWVIGGMVVAGLLDFGENHFIANMIATAEQQGSSLTAAHLSHDAWSALICSWPKWIISLLVIGYCLSGLPLLVQLVTSSVVVCWRSLWRKKDGALVEHERPVTGWTGPTDFVRYVLTAGPPSRPDDWAERGWDRNSKPNADNDYGRWFVSGTRLGMHFVLKSPELVIALLVLYAMVCGWGTLGFGVPYLFVDPDTQWRALASGVAVGLLMADIAFMGCLIWSEEWQHWWLKPEDGRQDESVSKITDEQTKRGMLVRHFVHGVLWFQMVLLVIAVAASKPMRTGWWSVVAFGAGLLLAGIIAWFVFSRLISWDQPAANKNLLARRLQTRGITRAGKPLRSDALAMQTVAVKIVLIISALGGVGFVVPGWFAWLLTPGLLCLALGSIVNVLTLIRFYGLLSKPVRSLAGVVVAVTLLSIVWPRPEFLHTYSDNALVGRYARPVNVPVLATESDLGAAARGIDNGAALQNWRLRFHGDSSNRPKLVVVCTAGGGIMASAWTTRVLTELDHAAPTVGFMQHVRIITGSSGGIVGAAHCVSAMAGANEPRRLPYDACIDADQLYTAVTTPSLNESVTWMVLRDLPNIWARPLWNVTGVLPWDRGEALQAAWEDTSKQHNCGIGKSLGSLRDLELQGAIPSLIVSPTIVEDGRQLLISNLDLRRLEGVDIDGDGVIESRSVLSLRALFPNEIGQLKLGTAARMTATFPFVSPAAELPTDPPIRLVDSGYTENYGVKTACLWLVQHRQELAAQTSGVIVVQLRAGMTTDQLRDHSGIRSSARWHQFSGLASPLTAVGNARGTTNLVSNEERLYLCRHQMQSGGPSDPQVPLDVITFDCPFDASLNWRLTASEKERLGKGLQTSWLADGQRCNLPGDIEAARHELNKAKGQPREPLPPDLRDVTLGVVDADKREQRLSEQTQLNNLREYLNLASLLSKGARLAP